MMAITAGKKTLFLAVAFFSAAMLFAQWEDVSSLVQYGENIEPGRLELLEDRQTLQYIGDLLGRNFTSGSYTIRNNGSDYTATLGVLLTATHGYPFECISEMQFFVNGTLVQYYVTPSINGFRMGETVLPFQSGDPEYPIPINTAWALVNMQFPANSTLVIQVQYVRYPSAPQYNRVSLSVTGYFPPFDVWRDVRTRFSLEIINSFTSGNNVEDNWIFNIRFAGIEEWAWNLNMYDYLRELQSMEADLMTISRPSSNIIKIEFTEKFIENFRRSFLVETLGLRSVWSDDYFILGSILENQGMHYDSFPRAVNLNIRDARDPNQLAEQTDITQRELAPYELLFLTSRQLRVMRNAFFARHGFVFQSADLQNIFALIPGYRPNPNFTEDMLTDIDRANIATIQRLEALAGD